MIKIPPLLNHSLYNFILSSKKELVVVYLFLLLIQHPTTLSHWTSAAVRVTLYNSITVCCLYILPSSFIIQLHTPVMLLGNFNDHNYSWGCRDVNAKVKLKEAFISKHNICLLNDKTSTYVHPASESYTSTDLFICDSLVFLNFIWRADNDLHGSDKISIYLHPARSHIHSLFHILITIKIFLFLKYSAFIKKIITFLH